MNHLVRRLVVLILLSVVAIGCASAQEKSMTTTECTILRIAERYIATHYPDFDSTHTKPAVKDLGDKWEVTYDLPEDMLGGTPVVIIDKHNSKILRAYHTQ